MAKQFPTQKHMVRKVLDTHGSISKLEAQHLNIGNVMEVIRRLRQDGMLIETVTKRDVTGQRYTRWVKRVA